MVGQLAVQGSEALTWIVLLGVTFAVPYGLLVAEAGSSFLAEGGPYAWVKMTMGRPVAAINTVLYWVTNPLWLGGSLAFLATQAWSSAFGTIANGSIVDYASKTCFIWVTILSAIVSLRFGKWLPVLGAVIKIVLVGFFTATVVLYAADRASLAAV